MQAHTQRITLFDGLFRGVLNGLIRRFTLVQICSTEWRVGAFFSNSEVRLIHEKSSKSARELVLNGDADFPLHILVSSCWMSLLRRSKIFFLIFLSLMHFCAIDFLFNRPTLRPRLFRDLERHLTFGRKFFFFSTI